MNGENTKGYIHEMQEGAQLPPPTTLQKRRLLVIGVIASLCMYMAGDLTSYPFLTLGGLILLFISAVMVRRTTHSVADQVDESLDERQVKVRNLSYLTAYRLTGAMLAIALLAVFAFRGVAIPKETVRAVVSGMLFFAIVAPSCVVAWTEKDV